MKKTPVYFLVLCCAVLLSACADNISPVSNAAESTISSASKQTNSETEEVFPDNSDEETGAPAPGISAPILIVEGRTFSPPFARDNLLLTKEADGFKLIGREPGDSAVIYLESVLGADSYVGEAVKTAAPQNDLESTFGGSVYKADDSFYIVVTRDEDGSYLEYLRGSSDFYAELLKEYDAGDIYSGVYMVSDEIGIDYEEIYPDAPETYPDPE